MCVGVAVFRQLIQTVCGVVPVVQRGVLTVDGIPAIPAVVGEPPVIEPFVLSFQFFVLKGDCAHADMLRLPDDGVLDGPEFFLLRELWAFALLLRIVIVHLTLELPPLVVALADDRQTPHLIHDLVHDFLRLLRKIAVRLFSVDRFQLRGQLLHEPLRVRLVADAASHLPGQLPQ